MTDAALATAGAHVQYSSANVRGVAVNRYLVNSEGTVVRHGYAGIWGELLRQAGRRRMGCGWAVITARRRRRRVSLRVRRRFISGWWRMC